ncbi:MAG: cobalamin biosynthesis protein P47K [Planctomycetes bacterium]|nr:cobalamin biosynthesis protein P47K [Planctomycetota bacterium]MBL7039066.1 cobalamin biosynthesis protein P47K [Pirellulaceae bacterium]
MSTIRFVLLGGFLGAGKTTTIARLARAYLRKGLNVGIVTNDQAADLVDTHNLRAQGFEVGEVAGACFCCRFDELTAAIEKLESRQTPDVILSEPVGSCADLVATVIQPIQRSFSSKFDVAPYGVILKPSHGRKILRNEAKGGFSPKAAYILRKQLHEADFVIVNRIDQLPKTEVDELEELVSAEVPDVPVLRLSALTGEGFEELLEMLDQRGPFGQRILDIDYDIYAEGEAELGWLNSHFRVEAPEPFALDDLLVDMVGRLQQSLGELGAETAHLKTIGLWEGYHAVANLVSSDSPVELSTASGCRTKTADIIVNARVGTTPELLQQHTERAAHEACATAGAAVEPVHTRSLRPGRPVPTYRIT